MFFGFSFAEEIAEVSVMKENHEENGKMSMFELQTYLKIKFKQRTK